MVISDFENMEEHYAVNMRAGTESTPREGDGYIESVADDAVIILKRLDPIDISDFVENGKLHIQICYEDIGNTDNHGWIWLQDKNGELLDCSYDVSFWDSSLTDSYDEYVFELPYEKLENYKIYAEFTNSGLLIEGDWQITFPMEQVK